MTYIINQCKLAGSNLIQSANNGYIASILYVHITLNISQFDICVDQTSRFGQKSVQITTIGSEEFKCDLCNEQPVIYGLCGDVLPYSELINGMYQCIYPFEYVDNKCICANGFLLNMTTCINVVESINNMNILANSNISNQILLLEQQYEIIENSLVIIDQNLQSNISEIENRIISNYSKSDYNLLMNISILDGRILSNITDVKQDIIIAHIKIDENLLYNTTILDWRIFNNISSLNNTIQYLSYQLQDVNNSFKLKNEITVITKLYNRTTEKISRQPNATTELYQQLRLFHCQWFVHLSYLCDIRPTKYKRDLLVHKYQLNYSSWFVYLSCQLECYWNCLCMFYNRINDVKWTVCMLNFRCICQQQHLYMRGEQFKYIKQLQLSKWSQFSKWSLYLFKYQCIYFWKLMCLSNIFNISGKYVHVSKQLKICQQ
ncbi:Hypothetical_protein [Hexamita inflata]|uniref:Hypothetical_protein n=1 Tax=Hexamita inflata TaxID=28002 RepID=A0ABP1JGR7_9EUKA